MIDHENVIIAPVSIQGDLPMPRGLILRTWHDDEETALGWIEDTVTNPLGMCRSFSIRLSEDDIAQLCSGKVLAIGSTDYRLDYCMTVGVEHDHN